MSLETFLKTEAADLGFDVCRICRVDEAWSAGARLQTFVAAGYHGEMAWMETTLERRRAPTAMWAAAKSAVVVGLNWEEVKTIAVETGVQNSTVGITLGAIIGAEASGFSAFALPSAVYGITMYLVTLPVVMWLRTRQAGTA